MVDKKFFLHELSVVAIIKNEARYLEEWLNYHLIAGVDHFYLYDNDSTDDTREILEPYIEAEIVECFPVSGEPMKIPVYNDAVRRFKFATRYMAFIDCNEFIFPKKNQSISEVVDEVLTQPERAALVANWQVFGSNNLEKADFEKGVLERFTRRAPRKWFEPPKEGVPPFGNIHVKTIANPRFIRAIVNPHFAFYFEGKYAVNSAGNHVPYWGCDPLTDKIVINHYFTKSKEEFQSRSDDENLFEKNDRNEEFDDDILKYQELRIENYVQPPTFDKEKYFKILEGTLIPAVRLTESNDEFFQGKLETFMTCRALAGVLKKNSPKDNRGKFMEETALRLVNRTFFTEMSIAEIMMMLNSLPPILGLPYPVVGDIHKSCVSFVRQIMEEFRKNLRWEEFVELGNYLEMLMAFDNSPQS